MADIMSPMRGAPEQVDVLDKIRGIELKEEQIERALEGKGSYLGLSLERQGAGAVEDGGGAVRKELVDHLRNLESEKKLLQEKEIVLLRGSTNARLMSSASVNGARLSRMESGQVLVDMINGPEVAPDSVEGRSRRWKAAVGGSIALIILVMVLLLVLVRDDGDD